MSTINLRDIKNNHDTETEKIWTGSYLLSKNKKEKLPITDDEALFDSLMEIIGNDGPFQNRFNFLYNFILVILATMPYLNIVLAMSVPDHWCYVPGREYTNYTKEEWKAITIPKEKNTLSTVETYSSCQMYNYSNGTNKNGIIACENGWEYDRQWYTQTAPSLQNWVCDRELYVTNTFAAGRVGEIIGAFIFGQLGDQIGRRPVFYIALTVLVLGRTSSAFVSHNYSLFIATVVIGSLASINIFQSPLVICMEVSAENKRAYIAFIQCLGWVIGMCALPMIAWICKDWVLMMICTTVPCAVFFFTFKLLPESPRWLASKGRVKKSADVLKHIAKINKTNLPVMTHDVLQKIADKKEKFYGVATLFIHWRLAKNSVIITVCWIISNLSYYTLVLNVSSMAGNPFMNFFWQSVVELPAFLLGRYLSDFLGRRWTQSCTYMTACILNLVLITFYNHFSSGFQILLVSLIKVAISCSFYIVWLQAIEVYPTCVRQTGTAIGGMMANVFGILAPYVVLLGSAIDVRLPYVVLLILTLLGAISSSFLPETFNRKLPETLEDAKNFGKDQKYWSFTKPKDTDEISMLNGSLDIVNSQVSKADEEDLFGTLMETLGNNGQFQKRFNILYNFILISFTTMSLFNVILAMAIPEHWCHVPGRAFITREKWKRLTIPRLGFTLFYNFLVLSNPFYLIKRKRVTKVVSGERFL